MSTNRAPTRVWCLRRDQFEPMVYTIDGDKVCIEGEGGVYLDLSRKDARLLAKRINQCLDGTVKR